MNRFDYLQHTIKKKFNALIISETKFDQFFPLALFELKFHVSSCRLDGNKNFGGTLLYYFHITILRLTHRRIFH